MIRRTDAPEYAADVIAEPSPWQGDAGNRDLPSVVEQGDGPKRSRPTRFGRTTIAVGSGDHGERIAVYRDRGLSYIWERSGGSDSCGAPGLATLVRGVAVVSVVVLAGAEHAAYSAPAAHNAQGRNPVTGGVGTSKVWQLEDSRFGAPRLVAVVVALAESAGTERDVDVAKLGGGETLVFCSFCNKPQGDVDALIALAGAYICNECVELCADLLLVDAETSRDSSILNELPAVTPRIVVDDVEAKVHFLCSVFGATGEDSADRPAQVRIGDSAVMVSSAAERGAFPAFLYVYVPDADAVYRRALEAGAVGLEEPRETPYGDRRAMVRDRAGNVFQIAHREVASS